MTTPRAMMGFDSPADKKVPVRVGNWNAMKLALWRSKGGWTIAHRAALEILERCQHSEGCPGEKIETEACLRECPDREVRMSALVILNAARTCVPADAAKPAEQRFYAPSREYFSEVIAELETTKAENEALHEALRQAGVVVPLPNEVGMAITEPQLEEKTQ